MMLSDQEIDRIVRMLTLHYCNKYVPMWYPWARNPSIDPEQHARHVFFIKHVETSKDILFKKNTHNFKLTFENGNMERLLVASFGPDSIYVVRFSTSNMIVLMICDVEQHVDGADMTLRPDQQTDMERLFKHYQQLHATAN